MYVRGRAYGYLYYVRVYVCLSVNVMCGWMDADFAACVCVFAKLCGAVRVGNVALLSSVCEQCLTQLVRTIDGTCALYVSKRCSHTMARTHHMRSPVPTASEDHQSLRPLSA